GGVRIQGTTGTVTVSGDKFRSTLGLRSTLITEIRQNVAVDPCAGTGAPTSGVSRHAGASRVETAVEVSKANWPQGGSEDVLLATSQNFPDALASASLAAALDAPLLLTPTSSLAPAVEGELARLGAKTVWILGGTAAVSAGVEEELGDLGYDTRRVRGGNRFETARAIALAPEARQVGTVALGMDQDWPSAATAGALATLPERIPTLLVHTDAVPEVTETTLAELGAREVILVGGTGAISADVDQRLRDLGYQVRRLAGDSRYSTSSAVAGEVLAKLPAGQRTLVVATGNDFPDALAAGALAARLDGPMLLSPQCTLGDSPATSDFLTANKARLDKAALVGGRAALSDRVMEQVAAGIGG
ncbi:MAG TPA: cell wall-binding repeat-containing protein, partial [Egibacteraceae bacterium]|nr:cell wall-binding repeat-containing protein [Egibacteraceae bacterium]